MNNNNYSYLWDIVLEDIKKEIPEKVFDTWFLHNFISTVDFNKKTITLISSNKLVSDFLKSSFDSKLKLSLKNTTTIDFNIIYSYLDNNNKTINQENNNLELDQFINDKFFLKDKPSGMQNFVKQSSFIFEDDNYVKENKNSNFKIKENSFEYDYTSSIKENNSLNKNFKFSNFVIGEGNKYAFNLALTAAEYPGDLNPIFIYGGVGLGKTHLLHAIGNELKENNPNFKIECISSEKFINDFVTSIRPHKNFKNQNLDEKFREKYRNVDALLIDDIQFLVDKKETQNTFYHTFNELQMNNKQIVLISDRRPSQLDGLEDRLVSRFDSGAIADITPPDYETRCAIIKFKCEQYNIFLDDNIISYISGNITGNVRELEGILKEINVAKNTNPNKTIDIQIAEEIIKRRIKTTKKKILPENIIELTSSFFNISVNDILSAKRNKELVQARMIAMYLCRELTDLSLPAIGKFFNKDHSSIFYSINKISSLISENDKNIIDNVEYIKEKINNI